MKVGVEFDLEADGRVLTPKEAGVKDVMDVPENIPADEIADWISDQTGWCVSSWKKLS